MINVVLFASLREELGVANIRLDSEEIASVSDIIAELGSQKGDQWRQVLSRENTLIALNQEMTDKNAGVVDEDEVAFFPPVTGG